MTSERGEARLEGSVLGSGGWWVVENGVELQGSIVSESGTKRQKTGHAVDTNLGEVIIVWTFDCFFLLLNFLVLKFKNCPDRQNISLLVFFHPLPPS